VIPYIILKFAKRDFSTLTRKQGVEGVHRRKKERKEGRKESR
jgi:hypothetical protein